MSYIEKSVGAQAQYAGVARCSRCGEELPPTAKHASPAQCIDTLRARVPAIVAALKAERAMWDAEYPGKTAFDGGYMSALRRAIDIVEELSK